MLTTTMFLSYPRILQHFHAWIHTFRQSSQHTHSHSVCIHSLPPTSQPLNINPSCLCAVNMNPSTFLLLQMSWRLAGVLGCRERSPPRCWRGQLSRQRGLKSETMSLFSRSDRRLPLRVSRLLSHSGPRCRPSACTVGVFGCFRVLWVLRGEQERSLCVCLCVWRVWLTAIIGGFTGGHEPVYMCERHTPHTHTQIRTNTQIHKWNAGNKHTQQVFLQTDTLFCSSVLSLQHISVRKNETESFNNP